jgi:hypothetical protein
MKTPRQILLEEHSVNDSQLESIHRDIIARSIENRAKRLGVRHSSAALALVRNVWNEILLPARRIWLTYVFIWVAIAAFYIATADHTVMSTAVTANPSDAVANLKEQQIILVELLKPTTIEPADRPKEQPMRPRSEATRMAIG